MYQVARTNQYICYEALEVASKTESLEVKFEKIKNEHGREVVAVTFIQDCLSCPKYSSCYSS